MAGRSLAARRRPVRFKDERSEPPDDLTGRDGDKLRSRQVDFLGGAADRKGPKHTGVCMPSLSDKRFLFFFFVL